MTTSLITGANRGIGLALSRALAARGHEVIAVCRSKTPELAQQKLRIESDIDVRSETSLRDLAERLAGVRIDWLIANAGVLLADSLDDLNIEAVEEQIE